jgi:lincosamide nucleotidyltransferase A/C/D/E
VLLGEVLGVLAALDQARLRWWIAGGWGVDALLGRQTREHRDLDLAVDAAEEGRVVAALAGRGYRIETDQRPARLELAAERGWVDLHPVRFGQDGVGHQADLAGGFFHYPATAWRSGVLGGRAVSCLSAGQQLEFRRGYELREVDRHDIRLLRELTRPPS